MLRLVTGVLLRESARLLPGLQNAVIPKATSLVNNVGLRSLSIFSSRPLVDRSNIDQQRTLLSQPLMRQILANNALLPTADVPVRNVTKYSLRKGKRKTVKAVIKRFYRLDWGIWIRTKAARHKRLWRKTAERKRRLRRHVFCNATQSQLLDIMVNKYWRKPKYYVDDPYNPYHKREEFPLTRRSPRPY